MKCKLSYVSEIISGATPSTTHDEYYDGDVVWFTPKDLSDQNTKYVERGARNITAEGFRSCSARMIPPYNLLMSSRAPIGLLSINEVECCTNQGFKSMVVDKTKADVDYLYYYIKHHLPEVEALGSGTTFKEVSRASLEKWEIDIPDLHTQKEISSILSFLDRKISLNRKANEVLEKMAKQLYDYWFVQFDFPDENGKPYKSSGGKMVYNEALKREIPDGWEVKKLSDITHDNMKSINPSDTPNVVFKHFSIPAFDTCENYAEELGETIKSSKNIPTSEDVLVSKLNPWTSRVIWGIDDDHVICSTEFVSLAPNEKEDKGYIYMLAKTLPFMNYCTKASTGTSHSHRRVNPEIMKMYVFPYNKEVVRQYSTIVSECIEKTIVNKSESLRLTSIRDFLLPMLMNGQVTIKNND